MVGDERTVPNLDVLNNLDSDEILEGYRDGRAGLTEPGNNRSLAYWQGWRNGALDGGYREKDAEQAELARQHQNREKGRKA